MLKNSPKEVQKPINERKSSGVITPLENSHVATAQIIAAKEVRLFLKMIAK
ncbi:MAG TPA: hypothetical protein VEC37_07705 [Bacillota bacterium]|nr:hypothetical protein [Bacillota bacterium]